MKNILSILILLCAFTAGAVQNIADGKLSSNLNANRMKITNVVDIIGTNGSSLLGGGSGGSATNLTGVGTNKFLMSANAEPFNGGALTNLNGKKVFYSSGIPLVDASGNLASPVAGQLLQDTDGNIYFANGDALADDSGNVTATSFTGAGSGLTGIPLSALTGIGSIAIRGSNDFETVLPAASAAHQPSNSFLSITGTAADALKLGGIAAANYTTGDALTNQLVTYSSNNIPVINPGHFPNLFGYMKTNWLLSGVSEPAYTFFFGDSHINNFPTSWKPLFSDKVGCDGSGLMGIAGTNFGGAFSTNTDFTRSMSGSYFYIPNGGSVTFDANGAGSLLGPLDTLIIPYHASNGAGAFSVQISTNADNAFQTLVTSASCDNGGALNIGFTNITLPRGYYRYRVTCVIGSVEIENGILVRHDGRGLCPIDFSYGGIELRSYTNVPVIMVSNWFKYFQPRLQIWCEASDSTNWQNSADIFVTRQRLGFSGWDLAVMLPPPDKFAATNSGSAFLSLQQSLYQQNWCASNNFVCFKPFTLFGGSWSNIPVSMNGNDSIHLNQSGYEANIADFWEQTGLSALNIGREMRNTKFVFTGNNGTDIGAGWESQVPGVGLTMSFQSPSNTATTLQFKDSQGRVLVNFVVQTNNQIKLADGGGNQAFLTAGSAPPGFVAFNASRNVLVPYQIPGVATPYFGAGRQSGNAAFEWHDGNGVLFGVWSAQTGGGNFLGINGTTNPAAALDVNGGGRFAGSVNITNTTTSSNFQATATGSAGFIGDGSGLTNLSVSVIDAAKPGIRTNSPTYNRIALAMAINTSRTNSTTTNATLMVQAILTTAATGVPMLVYSNFTSGDAMTNSFPSASVGPQLVYVTYPGISPSDVVGLYDKSTGTGASVGIVLSKFLLVP